MEVVGCGAGFVEGSGGYVLGVGGGGGGGGRMRSRVGYPWGCGRLLRQRGRIWQETRERGGGRGWDGSEDGAGVGQVFGGDSGELLRRWFRATAHQGSESGVRSAAVGSLPVLGSLLINLGQDTMNSW